MSDDRLMRAFAADAAPARDAAYTLAVLERAEAERWRAAQRLALVRGAGLAFIAAAAALGLSYWASAAPEAATSALLGAAILFVVIGAARRVRGRLQRA